MISMYTSRNDSWIARQEYWKEGGWGQGGWQNNLDGNQNMNNQVNTINDEVIIFYDNEDTYFECAALGGYPEPSLRVVVGDRTLSVQDEVEYPMVGTIKCQQLIEYEIVSYNQKMRLGVGDDGKMLTCEATVNKVISGSQKYAKKQEREVVIYCKYLLYPLLS